MSLNHFRNKRQAHAVSRASSDQAWNPFRHVWGGRRAQTWAGLETQEGRAGVVHSATEPTTATTRVEPEHVQSTTARLASADENVDVKTPELESGLRHRKPVDDGGGGDAEADAATPVPVQGKPAEEEKQTNKHSRFLRHLEPKTPFTVSNQLQRTFLNSWINMLLVAAPVGIALNYVPAVPRVAVFVVNFVAIIPLAAMLSFATEEIALRTGETLGGLLNATFGNAVEVIVSIIALIDGKIQIVKTSLIVLFVATRCEQST
ncbi:hypothetical protein XA68_16339 [Ophiocordyceps unilateralis]|uniref:Sodium/calcium exchanger membrane region domain-containing protein n=1 Tax=Ophiocordyceps unilateralis TaxID=268505 RepID=A0A2A9P6T4_OPHUN|nr:hypothetical protein XA68_16339 [Ophiocordyceps unilateralis]